MHQSYKYNYLEIQRWRKHWLPRQHWSLCWCQEWTLLWEEWLWPRLWSKQHVYGSRKTPSPRCVCVAAAEVDPGSQIYTHSPVSSSMYVTVLLITIRHSLSHTFQARQWWGRWWWLRFQTAAWQWSWSHHPHCTTSEYQERRSSQTSGTQRLLQNSHLLNNTWNFI